MKNYRLLLSVIIMTMTCISNTAEQMQLYAFCAEDCTVIETRLSPQILTERCSGMQTYIFEHSDRVIQRLDDGALEIDLPIESMDELSLFGGLLHCDSVEKVQKYINRFEEYRSIIAELSDLFDMPYVRAALNSSWMNEFESNYDLANALLRSDHYETPPSSPEYYASLATDSEEL